MFCFNRVVAVQVAPADLWVPWPDPLGGRIAAEVTDSVPICGQQNGGGRYPSSCPSVHAAASVRTSWARRLRRPFRLLTRQSAATNVRTRLIVTQVLLS